MTKSHWLIYSVLGRVAVQARGPALPLAKGLLELISQYIASGMPVKMALRESLLLAIHSAQVKAKHCVGSERYALDDFINYCMNIEVMTEQLVRI
ncbi:MAG: hypothetical protein ACFFBR_00335 [Promethearchaeota archaeon]